MADTPRVTVPVEPTEAMIDAACNVGPDTNNGAFSYDDARTVFAAMLSASPAPEGGAVSWAPWGGGSNPLPDFGRHVEATLRNGRVEKAYSSDFRWQHHDYETDIIAYRIPALAAREEAPAGAGDGDRLFAEAPIGTAALYRDLENGVRPLLALRAQPPAREDAQPVAWAIRYAGDSNKAPLAQVTMSEEFAGMMKHQGHEVIALGPITHPAPDALRVAVEALEFYADEEAWVAYGEDAIAVATDENVGTELGFDSGEKARQALAALQAEQKGGVR